MTDPFGRETIVSLSSAPGIGAVALLRVSGPDSCALTEAFLEQPVKWRPGRLYYRRLIHNGRLIDDVVLGFFQAPHSYTGEDVVEISCHGNPRLVQEIIQLYLSAGARMARPGEFTERAFLNDKISLTQAEGVLDVITASTERALASAQAMKDGRLGQALAKIRDELVDLLSHLEASLDFAEDGIEPEVGAAFFARIQTQQQAVQLLLKTAPLGRILREGALVVIVGEPNVGKSSLLNALLREDRAIVSPTPGTTRDLIEAECSVRGLPIRLVDTAGQREAHDPVEAEGIRRAQAKRAQADLVLQVVEAHLPFASVTLDPIHEAIQVLLLANKSDLGVHPSLPADAIQISATTSDGMVQLEERIEKALLGSRDESGTSVLAVNSRQSAALERVDQTLERARVNGLGGAGLELVSVDLRDALQEMADVIGETTNEDILTRLFQNFCIGK